MAHKQCKRCKSYHHPLTMLNGRCSTCNIKLISKAESLRAENLRLKKLVGEEFDGVAADMIFTDVEILRAENERYKNAFQRLQNWAKAYPLKVFPEPDFKKVRAALEPHGITLDAVSASNMRDVITQVMEILEQALKET